MEIFSETGYLIIMDPHYLQLGNQEEITGFDFLKNPKQAANNLERKLFPNGGTDKIGLIILSDGPGKYHFDVNQVSFWDVEDKVKTKSIFGVELGSFIIFDIKYIQKLVAHFDKLELERMGEEAYFNVLKSKLATENNLLIWNRSQVGIGDGWHEINWQAFEKC